MKVSVIIPVYNTEEYLQDCVNSVLAQSCDDMEILLIDDGSNDKCGKICDEYAAHYSCVRTVHLDHSGIGCARNEGLHIASGEYIVFVDSDDLLASGDCIQKMISLLDETHADAAVGNYGRLWDGNFLEATKHSSFSQMEPGSAYFRFGGFFSVGTLSYVWGKAYRRSFLRKHNIVFGSYEYAEDKMFNFQCFLNQAQYVFLDDVVYIYRKNNTSVSHQPHQDHTKCWLQISADLVQYLKEKNLDTQYGDLAAFTVNFAAFFDGKSEYCKSNKKIQAIKDVLKIYADSPVAYQCFCQLSRGIYIDKSIDTGWRFMMWGFAFLMKNRALAILALGIKLLIDFRIDERLSDTGIKKK